MKYYIIQTSFQFICFINIYLLKKSLSLNYKTVGLPLGEPIVLRIRVQVKFDDC